MSKTINQLVQEAHQNAIAKGWHDTPISLGDQIANMHAELSEAWEDYRRGYQPNEERYLPDTTTRAVFRSSQDDPTWKPIGIPSELADVVIRVFDTCGYFGIDLEKAIAEKMAYNATRPHKHGGKLV